MRTGKLIEKARFSHTGFTHYRDDLTVSGTSLFQSLPQSMYLSITPYEARKSTGRSGFHARSDESSPGNFINLDPLIQTLHIDPPKRFYFHIAFGQTQRFSRDENGTRGCHLFHARSQMCSLANCRVVHL